MTDEPIKEDPVEKFRKLIASFIPLSRRPKKEEKDTAPEKAEQVEAEPPAEVKDALSALPKKTANKSNMLNSLPRKQDEPKSEAKSAPAAAAGKVASAKPEPASKLDPKPESASEKKSSFFGPRFWTTASVISLTINVITIAVLIILLISVRRLGLDVNYVMAVGKDLVGLPGGLYNNFEKMERANIQTNVVVNTSIPVKFDLQLNQETNVVLSQDVTITNALVTVNTGGLNISRANTTIVLPQGTNLPIVLNLTVPVDTQVPVTLNVPVDIPLKETQLNEPFVGLQNVIKPLYCFIEPNAVNMDGQPICP